MKLYIKIVMMVLIKWISIIVIIPIIFLSNLFLLDSLKGKLYELTAPMVFHFDFEEDISTITELIKFTKLNIKFDILYFMVLLLSTPLTATIDILRIRKNETIWAMVIYITIVTLALVISVFIIFVNGQYYLKYFTSVYVGYAFICNTVGLCFCVLMCNKFIDDIILSCKTAVDIVKKKLKK